MRALHHKWSYSNKVRIVFGMYQRMRSKRTSWAGIHQMHKIDWCEGGLKLADIATKNVGEHDLIPRIKYIMVRLDN